MISINATAMTTPEKTIAIDAGQLAVFKGFLVPEWQFRKMNQDLIEADILRKQVQTPQVKEPTFVEGLLWGFIAGSTTILCIEKFGGK